jgi:predicted phosphoribosyltransferase
VFLVRKLGVPGHEELAMGAIASGGVLVVNEELVESLGIPRRVIDAVVAREEPTVILVDDGLATGSTMRAAATALRVEKPARLVIAVPVAAQQACEELAHEADEIVCARTPEPFFAVGTWYVDFSQTSDEEVRELLAQVAAERASARR